MSQEIKIASLFSENARKATKLLENGTLTYKQRSVEGRDVLDIFVTIASSQSEEHSCPKCQSKNVSFAREGYEDGHMEMIEDFLVCLDCNYDERRSN
jgi:hypothetical protein